LPLLPLLANRCSRYAYDGGHFDLGGRVSDRRRREQALQRGTLEGALGTPLRVLTHEPLIFVR
jgi:hypothetical protein